MELGEVVSIAPQECSVRGGEHLVLTFCNPVSVPDEESTFLYFSGSEESHKVSTARHSPNSLVASVPCHSTAETVELILCNVDESGLEKTMYKTNFTYFFDQKAFMADMMFQSVHDGGSSLYGLFPPLSSPDAVREYDLYLMEALREVEVPEGWSMIGTAGKDGQLISTVEDCKPKETLLHFAARHSLNSLAQHLLSLPGSSIAAILPNEEGRIPIQIAQDNSNEGLVQLLTLYMKQVRPDGKFIVSPSPSPKESPNCLLGGEGMVISQLEEDASGDPVQDRSQDDQEQEDLEANIQELIRINEEWRGRVKCSKLPHTAPTRGNEVAHRYSLSPRASKRRRSLCAFVSIPPRVMGASSRDSSEHYECVSRVQDPEIQEMDRQRRLSWSVTVGAVDSRSIDTGLNELHRITAEEVLQKRLFNLRRELTEMEQGSKTSNQQAPTQSQLILRSLSCPMLDQSDDEEDESVSPIGSSSPKSSSRKKIEKSSSSASSILTSTSSHVPSRDPTPHHSDPSYRLPQEGGISPQIIPRVITTKYSIDSSDLDFHADAGHSEASLSASVDDLENSSGDQLDEEGERGDVSRKEERSMSLLVAQSLVGDELSPGYSTSAPNLLQGLSDTEEQDEISTKALAAVPVEESIMEHRSLRQMGAYSPVSDEMRDTGTDHTNTSVDSDFVIVLSPNQHTTPPQGEETDSDKEIGNLTRSVPSAKSTHRSKMHRRSLSTSDVENMRDVARKSEDEKAGQIEEEVGGGCGLRPNTVAVLTPISNGDDGDGGRGSTRRTDVDEHSQAGSVQTMDTCSHHGSDDSSEEDNGETDDQLSALESQISVDAMTSDSRTKVNYNGVSSLSPVVLRGPKKRTANPLNRYSAEYLITNIDDDLGNESDDAGETTPTSSVLNRFSHRRINSTSAPMSTVGAEGGGKGDEEEFDGGHVEKLGMKNKKISSDSVFLSNPEVETINLSDVDVKLNNSDDAAARSLETSLDASMEQSSEVDIKYYTTTGLPRTIRKKGKKSSKTSRKKGSPSPSTEKQGLRKEDVSPTIKHLRKLIDLEELEDSCSDDSDTTVGSGPVRTTSALERTSASSSIQRSKSSVSDSVALQEHRTAVSFANTVPGHRTGSPSSVRSYPIQQDLEHNPREGSSLDFGSGSPNITRQQQQIYNQLVQPASPLSFSITRSPPISQSHSTEAFTGSKNRQYNSSPSFPLSPTAGSFTPNTVTAEEELQHAASQNPRQHKPGKFEKSKSVYESGTEPVSFFMDLNEEEKPLDKDQEGSAVKKFMRGGFFRGSKLNTKKGSKAIPTSKSESDQYSPSHTKRAKSAKLRTKPNDSPLEADPSPASSITRSASMQVGLQNTGIHVNKRQSTHMTRYNSDDILSSPTKIRNAQSMTILEEMEANGRSFAFPFPPSQGSGGESDNEEGSRMDQIALTANHPELQLKEELVWERTVDRKVYKKINKSERERQAILHELLHTEKQHFRALHVLKLIFLQGISKQVPEETLNLLFPKLEELIVISKDFITRMDKKRVGNMINDLSDVLLQQFTGEKYAQMYAAFSGFCSGHLNAMEIYKDLFKKKNFMRLMNDLHSVKECQRLTLPDYYTKVTQRLSQLITLMNRLAKKTESLKLDHCPVLLESMSGLQHLVAAVDQAVEDSKNLMELMDIQGRLEINVPKSTKITNRQDLKNLSLTAHNRKLKKRGDATWMGHGRQLGVQVVLVTDFVVLLTERDQKFHLATLQDLKPPVIRLYDLMVRTNASVKSGVQLLLVEQSSTPEMYKLDFADKKKAKEWLSSLNAAIEECREKGLKCEYFGAERVTSGDEDKRHDEKEAESGEEGKAARAVPNILPSKSDPELQRHHRAMEVIQTAEKLLSTVNSMTADHSAASRHQDAASAGANRILLLRQRAQTVRPKTSYFPDEPDAGGTVATLAGHTSSGDHVISFPQLVSHPTKSKTFKEKDKKKVARSSTFRNKEKKEKEKEKEDKKEEKQSAAGSTGVTFQQRNNDENSARSEQIYIQCITALKCSLEDMMNESEDKSKRISKLQEEVLSLKQHTHKGKRKDHGKKPSHQHSPRASPPPPYLPSSSSPCPAQTTTAPVDRLELSDKLSTPNHTSRPDEDRGLLATGSKSPGKES